MNVKLKMKNNNAVAIPRTTPEGSPTVKRSLAPLGMTLAMLVPFFIFNFTFYIILPVPQAQAEGGCIAGASCPAGQVQGTGPCPVLGQIFCEPAATPSAPSTTPSAPSTTTGVQLPNPLGTSDYKEIAGRIIQVLTGGAGVIALLMFVYGGFQWLTAGGNPEKIKKGKDILLWSILGIVVMFGSYIAVRYIITALLRGAAIP